MLTLLNFSFKHTVPPIRTRSWCRLTLHHGLHPLLLAACVRRSQLANMSPQAMAFLPHLALAPTRNPIFARSSITSQSPPILRTSRQPSPLPNLCVARASSSSSSSSSSATTSPSASPALPSLPRAAAARLALTHYDGSSFGLEYDAPHLSRPLRVLVDPWLVGDLVFGGQPAFYRGRKQLAQTVPLSAFGAWDLIVLSQDLPDHCHVPTLEQLPRSIPVVCPRKAVPILQRLGYATVRALAPGEVTAPFAAAADSPLSELSVRGGRGSVTGPPWSEPQLAFCFEFGASSEKMRVYLETHGMHDARFLEELTRSVPLDVFISPVISMTIPVLGNYDVIYGTPELVETCKEVRPRTVVPFDNSRTEGSGALEAVVKLEGGYDVFREAVEKQPVLRDMRIIEPELMKPVVIGGLQGQLGLEVVDDQLVDTPSESPGS